jgi:hypothetical protein
MLIFLCVGITQPRNALGTYKLLQINQLVTKSFQ